MPYQGEFAGYRPLQRIADTDRVKTLLGKARVFQAQAKSAVAFKPAPVAPDILPSFVVAIDGSNAEVDVKNGYPGAKVGYCTVASVLLNMELMAKLDEVRPVDPREFRKVEQPATIDAALPGSNVVLHNHQSAQDSFREALHEVLHDVVPDVEDKTRLLDTYEELLARKPKGTTQACPYEQELGCGERLTVGPGHSTCACPKKLSLWSTDALRIHEGFRPVGSNREVLGEVMQVWERIFLVHLLRCFERKGWINHLSRLAFFVDGPLAVFGHPAWLSAAIRDELKRINKLAAAESGQDMIIIGVEKTGEFVTHFEELDRSSDTNTERFERRTFLLPTDAYIKERIKFSNSPKRYGEDTYFGRKLFYKTASGARIVATIPFLSDEQDTIDDDDETRYPALPVVFGLLDKLVSSRFPNAMAPLISANAQAAIPLELGAKVLQQLAQALVSEKK